MAEKLVAEINRIRNGEDRWKTFMSLAESAPGPTQAYMKIAVDYLTISSRPA